MYEGKLGIFLKLSSYTRYINVNSILLCIEHKIQSFANNLIKWPYKNDVLAIFNAETNIYIDREVSYNLQKCIVLI